MRVDWCVSSWFRIKNTHSLTPAEWVASGGPFPPLDDAATGSRRLRPASGARAAQISPSSACSRAFTLYKRRRRAGPSVFDLSVSGRSLAGSEGPGPLNRKQKQGCFSAVTARQPSREGPSSHRTDAIIPRVHGA